MRNRLTVGNFTESHRAKGSHPDRRIFTPQIGRLPSAAHFSEQLPQLRSAVPNSPTSVPIFPTPFHASTTTQSSGQSDAKKATAVKATDAANLYEHILTIQNAADLEFPALNPANAPARAEFKLGIFPPDHHVAPAAPTPVPIPTPATTPPAK